MPDARLFAALASALFVAACSAPQERAIEAGGPIHPGAFDQADGVTMTAYPDAWRATPRRLEERLIPILVTIRNNGAEPLRIREEEFRLIAVDGRARTAVPPLRIRGSVRGGPTGSVLLPNSQLLERALPEGVLPPGGETSGFVYFQRLPGARHVELQADLPRADGEPVTRLQVALRL